MIVRAGESNRHQVRGALGGGPWALVVDLRRCDLAVAEQFLDLDDVHAGVEEQGSGGGANRLRREDALAGC